jgi:hypothetical protein
LRDRLTVLILCTGAILAVDAGRRISIVYDEPMHVTAGLAYWQSRAFHIYPHNPPLIKLCLSLPLWVTGERIDPALLPQVRVGRPELMLAKAFCDARLDSIDSVVLRCRLVSALFFIGGGIVICTWSATLFGRGAGRLSAALWCFHPWCLAHGSVATTDMGAAVLGTIAARTFLLQLQSRRMWTALLAGVALGGAALSKFTLLTLYPAFFLAVAFAGGHAATGRTRAWLRLALVFMISGCVIPAGYLLTDVGHRLSDLELQSHRGRRARALIQGSIGPVADPVASLIPRSFLEGLDRQWMDVENGWPNYLHGQTRRAGFPMYYVWALLLKSPLVWAIILCLACVNWMRGHRGPAASESCLLLVPLLIAGLLQANTSLAYSRYLLPAVPFAIVWLSRAAIISAERLSGFAFAAWLGVACGILAPLLQHPGHLAYMNCLAGGPRNGFLWFADGDFDWGQDLRALAAWQQRHPGQTPMHIVVFSFLPPSYAGVTGHGSHELDWIALGQHGTFDRIPVHPSPGFLAISVTMLNRGAARNDVLLEPSPDFCRQLAERRPIGWAGSSIRIYHFSDEEVRRWQGTPARRQD